MAFILDQERKWNDELHRQQPDRRRARHLSHPPALARAPAAGLALRALAAAGLVPGPGGVTSLVLGAAGAWGGGDGAVRREAPVVGFRGHQQAGDDEDRHLHHALGGALPQQGRSDRGRSEHAGQDVRLRQPHHHRQRRHQRGLLAHPGADGVPPGRAIGDRRHARRHMSDHGEAPGLPPIELQAPDIGRWREGGSGIDWVHAFDSGRPGPQVLVQALTHGNEICGAIALDWLLGQSFRPRAGRLVLAFANVAAYARFDPADPFPSRLVDEDYNRVWADETLQGSGDTVELRRARELLPFVDAADLLLDIHSMSEPCRPLMVCGTVDKNAAYACQLGVPADLLIDTGHPAGLRMIDRGGFADPASPKRALLVECGQHWEVTAAEVAIDTLVRFLGLAGLADAAWVQAHVRLPLPHAQRLVRVTEPVVARSAGFRFLVPPVGLSVVAQAGTPIAADGERIWTTPYDNAVLVMPGTHNLKPGGTAVRIGRFEALPTSQA